MTELNSPGKVFDGTDQVIYSNSFNIYNNELTIEQLGFRFIFVFESISPKSGQKDIIVKPDAGKEVHITFSNKFRNSLGAATTEKLNILQTGDGKNISMTVFGQQVGSTSCLHITVTLYLG